MTMSDRIAIMDQGRLVQLGAGDEVYKRPRTRFVADFVGKINFVSARVLRVEDNWAVVESNGTSFHVPNHDGLGEDGEFTVAIRPEHLKIRPSGEIPNGYNALPGRIGAQSFIGNLLNVKVQVDDGSELMVECRPDDDIPGTGESVQVVWARDRAIVLEN